MNVIRCEPWSGWIGYGFGMRHGRVRVAGPPEQLTIRIPPIAHHTFGLHRLFEPIMSLVHGQRKCIETKTKCPACNLYGRGSDIRSSGFTIIYCQYAGRPQVRSVFIIRPFVKESKSNIYRMVERAYVTQWRWPPHVPNACKRWFEGHGSRMKIFARSQFGWQYSPVSVAGSSRWYISPMATCGGHTTNGAPRWTLGQREVGDNLCEAIWLARIMAI